MSNPKRLSKAQYDTLASAGVEIPKGLAPRNADLDLSKPVGKRGEFSFYAAAIDFSNNGRTTPAVVICDGKGVLVARAGAAKVIRESAWRGVAPEFLAAAKAALKLA